MNSTQPDARRAHNNARYRPGRNDLWQKYRTNCNAYKRSCLKAPTASWRTFTADQVSPTQAAKLNQILRRKAYNKLGELRKDDGSMTKTATESQALLMAEHFPGSQLLIMTELDPTNGPDSTGADSRYQHPVLVDPKSWIKLTALHLAF
jgi:hypothetical protein